MVTWSPSNFSRTQTVRKGAVRSENGVVAAQHGAAAAVGARVLEQGGNAVDAAIAVSFAIGVVEPWMSGPGGGGYMVIRRPGDDNANVIDFGMRSPAGLDTSNYPLSGGVASDLFPWPSVLDDRNVTGAHSVALPGQVAGMGLAHETYGTKSWADLLEPAIGLAGEGLLVDWYAQLLIAGVVGDLKKFPKSKETFLDAEGNPRASAWTALADQRCDMSAMQATLAKIAAGGPREFYEGAVARSIVKDLQAAGSSITEADLAAYKASIVPAHKLDHREGTVFLTPELTAGPTYIRTYELLRKAFDGVNFLGADTYVEYANALFTAYAERLARMGDVEGHRGCTTHFNVVDKDGMMVSVTQTLLSIFGSKLMLPESGVLMNNGIMWFDPEPGKPNSLAPGKRCLSNMCPIIGERSDGFQFALGASGGRKIMPAVLQISSFIMDYGMDLEAAFHTPRIDVSGGDTVVADNSLPGSVMQALDQRFRCVAGPRTVYPYNFGCPSAVARDGDENQGATEIMSPWGDAATY